MKIRLIRRHLDGVSIFDKCFGSKRQVGHCFLSAVCTSLWLALQSRAVVVQTHPDKSKPARCSSDLRHQPGSFLLSDSCSSIRFSVSVSCSSLIILHGIPPHASFEPSSSSLLTSELLSAIRIPSSILTYSPTHAWLVECNTRLFLTC